MLRNIIYMFIIFIFTGCNNINNQSSLNKINDRANAIIKDTDTKVYTNKNEYTYDDITSDVNEFDNLSKDIDLREKNISNEILKINNIKNVSIAIIDDSALVGIEFINDLSDKEIKKLKRSIELNVKNLDKNIKHVTITVVPELISRINNVLDFDYDENNIELNDEQKNIIEELSPVL